MQAGVARGGGGEMGGSYAGKVPRERLSDWSPERREGGQCQHREQKVQKCGGYMKQQDPFMGTINML